MTNREYNLMLNGEDDEYDENGYMRKFPRQDYELDDEDDCEHPILCKDDM